MPLFIVGGSISLAAGASGVLDFKSPVDGTITKISVSSTGRAEITDMEVTGQPDFFDGKAELESFKQQGNIYLVEPPLPIGKGDSVVISLKDSSGAANDIYVVVHITY